MDSSNWRKLDILARLIVAGFLIPAGIYAITKGDLILGIVAIAIALPYLTDLIKDSKRSKIKE